jgi:hypothetical protein
VPRIYLCLSETTQSLLADLAIMEGEVSPGSNESYHSLHILILNGDSSGGLDPPLMSTSCSTSDYQVRGFCRIVETSVAVVIHGSRICAMLK